MEKFKRDGIYTISDTEKRIESIYAELLHENRNRILGSLTEAVENNVRGIPDYKVEEWIEYFLIENLQYYGIQKNKELETKLENEFNQLCIELTNGIGEQSTLLDEFKRNLNTSINQIDISEFDEIINEFIENFTRRIECFFDAFRQIDSYRIESMLDDLRRELKHNAKIVLERLLDEYKDELHAEFNKLYNIINENIEKINPINKEEILKDYKEIMSISGYTIEEHNDLFFARDIKNDKLYEIIIDKDNIRLKGINIGFRIEGKDEYKQQFYVNEKDNRVCVMQKESFTMCNTKSRHAMTIFKVGDGYGFMYNYEVTTNPIIHAIIIDYIKKDYPEYYDKLMQDKNFRLISEEVSKKVSEAEEIFFSKDSQRVEINPQKREIFNKKFKIFGYEIIQKGTDLYAKDLLTDEEHLIKYDGSKFVFSDIPREKLNFITNLNYISDERITTGLSSFKKGNINLTFVNDSTINVSMDKTTYFIKLNKQGIACRKMDENNKTLNVSVDEIILLFQDALPYLSNYLYDYKEQVQGREQNPNTKK